MGLSGEASDIDRPDKTEGTAAFRASKHRAEVTHCRSSRRGETVPKR
jgi:hypothetical protein